MKITCTNCNKKFNYKKINLLKRDLLGGIEETYFLCPKCGKHYRVMITNEEIRQLQEQYNLLVVTLGEKYKDEMLTMHNKDFDDFHNLRMTIKAKLDELNGVK